MNAFALALAQEVDRDGINGHNVTPGPVETDMLADVPFAMYAIRAADVAEAVGMVGYRPPVGRRAGDQAARHHPRPCGAGTGGAYRGGAPSGERT